MHEAKSLQETHAVANWLQRREGEATLSSGPDKLSPCSGNQPSRMSEEQRTFGAYWACRRSRSAFLAHSCTLLAATRAWTQHACCVVQDDHLALLLLLFELCRALAYPFAHVGCRLFLCSRDICSWSGSRSYSRCALGGSCCGRRSLGCSHFTRRGGRGGFRS